MSRLSVLFLLLLLLSSCSNGTTGLGRDPSIDTLGPAPPRYDLENDMFLPYEGYMATADWLPEGGSVRLYNWYWKSNFNYQTKSNQYTWHGFDRIAAWGLVMASKEKPTPNTDEDSKGARVHIKDFRVYILRKEDNGNVSGWYEVLYNNKYQPRLGGAIYFNVAGYTYNGHGVDSEKVEGRDNEGRVVEISVTAGAGQNPENEAYGKPGFHYHFFWLDASKIDPNNNIPAENNYKPAKNVAGIYIVCKARLIGNYTADPRYLIHLGYDYWIGETLFDEKNPENMRQWDLNTRPPPDTPNGIDDGSGGRFKYVTPEWQYFTFHTFSPEEVKGILFPGEVGAQFYGEQ